MNLKLAKKLRRKARELSGGLESGYVWQVDASKAIELGEDMPAEVLRMFGNYFKTYMPAAEGKAMYAPGRRIVCTGLRSYYLALKKKERRNA